jgi:large subunit ribosomal protein L28e
MSANLVWQLVRGNSSFLVKNAAHDGTTLTKEPNNLRQVNSFKYSGLASRRPVGLTATDKGVTLTIATKRNQSKPAKKHVSIALNRDSRRAGRAIKAVLATNNYRPDLTAAALARLTALKRKPAKTANARKHAPRGAAARK